MVTTTATVIWSRCAGWIASQAQSPFSRAVSRTECSAQSNIDRHSRTDVGGACVARHHDATLADLLLEFDGGNLADVTAAGKLHRHIVPHAIHAATGWLVQRRLCGHPGGGKDDNSRLLHHILSRIPRPLVVRLIRGLVVELFVFHSSCLPNGAI